MQLVCMVCRRARTSSQSLWHSVVTDMWSRRECLVWQDLEGVSQLFVFAGKCQFAQTTSSPIPKLSTWLHESQFQFPLKWAEKQPYTQPWQQAYEVRMRPSLSRYHKFICFTLILWLNRWQIKSWYRKAKMYIAKSEIWRLGNKTQDTSVLVALRIRATFCLS